MIMKSRSTSLGRVANSDLECEASLQYTVYVGCNLGDFPLKKVLDFKFEKKTWSWKLPLAHSIGHPSKCHQSQAMFAFSNQIGTSS